MEIEPLRVGNAFRVIPEKHGDRRGVFYEAIRGDVLSGAIGYPFRVAQVNYSVSRRNTLRGIHATEVPPGQDKLVSCVRGAALDIVVDLRPGSPTFGEFDLTYQDEDSGLAVYLADGLGHAFLALADNTCMSYLCSAEYVPGTMIEVDGLDPELALPWRLAEPPIRSDKDARAPTLATAVASGRLPSYRECVAHYARLAEKA